MKRRFFWLTALATGASIFSFYIYDRRRKHRIAIPLHASEAGTVYLTAKVVERVVFLWLSEMRDVHPHHIRVLFRANESVHITGTIQSTPARGSSLPPIKEIEKAIHKKFNEWAGARWPAVTFQLKVHMKGKERR